MYLPQRGHRSGAPGLGDGVEQYLDLLLQHSPLRGIQTFGTTEPGAYSHVILGLEVLQDLLQCVVLLLQSPILVYQICSWGGG